MAAWHESRADAFERKASTLLGFVGVILVLLPTLRPSIAHAHGEHMRMLLVGLALAAAVLLALAALAAAMVLRPRPYTTPSLPQLREEWATYAARGNAHRTPEHITGLFVDQLVRRTDPSSSPLETLRDDAEKRAKWMKWATSLVLLGVLALASLTGGDVNSNRPHRDGLKWPQRSGRGAVCRRSWRLAPEDAGGVAVELGEQVVDSVRRCE